MRNTCAEVLSFGNHLILSLFTQFYIQCYNPKERMDNGLRSLVWWSHSIVPVHHRTVYSSYFLFFVFLYFVSFILQHFPHPKPYCSRTHCTFGFYVSNFVFLILQHTALFYSFFTSSVDSPTIDLYLIFTFNNCDRSSRLKKTHLIGISFMESYCPHSPWSTIRKVFLSVLSGLRHDPLGKYGVISRILFYEQMFQPISNHTCTWKYVSDSYVVIE